MRRWLCMMVLLFSLAGQGRGFATRYPEPVPIERQIGSLRAGRLELGVAWWKTS
jgi:hypothetical protein